MKKLKIDAIAFIFIISVLFLANLFNADKPTVSFIENRNLAQKPEFSFTELFSGRYFRGLEEYYSDTFIKRENMVKASKSMKDTITLDDPGITLVVVNQNKTPEVNENPTPVQTPIKEVVVPSIEPTKNPNEEPGKTSEPIPTTTPTLTPEPTQPPKEFGEDDEVGYYLIVDGKAVQVFKFNRKSIDNYARIVNKYSEILPEDVKIYSMIAPTAGEFVKLRKYKDIMDSQNDAMDYLYGKLDKRIETVNVYDKLNKHKDEYIFFKTDHHWTPLGAYYGYTAFAEKAGLEATEIDKYEVRVVENFLGSSYRKTLNEELKKNPDTINVLMPFTKCEYKMYYKDTVKERDIINFYYDKEGKDQNKYLIFLSSGGATWASIKTEVKNGKKILVMKDSFGNTLVPFLLPHYEEIYVVDNRFYNKNITGFDIPEFMAEHEINELLFIFYMEDINWKNFMEKFEKHLGD